jgi:uncharacterized protein DUF2252
LAGIVIGLLRRVRVFMVGQTRRSMRPKVAGSAADPLVMAHDLAALPSSGLHAQLSGDAHLLNPGGYASLGRDLVFDLNDFDETHVGPFEWDVKRLATSVEIAGRQRDLSRGERKDLVRALVSAYRTAIREFASMGDLDVWYSRLDARAMIEALRADRDRKQTKGLRRAVGKARSNDGRRALSTLTRSVDGEPRFVSEPPLIVPLADLAVPDEGTSLVRDVLRGYARSLPHDRLVLLERFHPVDVAQKVVGVRSVATPCWTALLLGRDHHDPPLLQPKEQRPPCSTG